MWAVAAVTYRVEGLLISRQRYWGTPIPIVYCQRDGIVARTGGGLAGPPARDASSPNCESPLKLDPDFYNTTCPRCGRSRHPRDGHYGYVRGLVVVPLPLPPPHYEGAVRPGGGEKWLPWTSNGGIEHATMHLLYTRFWTKVMRDLGIGRLRRADGTRFNQGIILGEDAEKMSKSRGNVVTLRTS